MALAELPVRKQKTVTVCGQEQTITKFPATKSVRYQRHLLKVAGPAFIESQKAEDTTIADVFAKFLENLDYLDEEVMRNMVVESIGISPAKFETMFSGETVELFKVLKEIVFFNYHDVFTLLGLEQTPE